MKREILLNTIKADAANGTDNATDILHRQYPGLSSADCAEIAATICAALTTENTEKVSLVVTAPPSFRINAKPTMTVVQSMLEKSQKGVFVKFFINNVEKQPDVGKLLRYKGRFLQIYDYSNEEDKMAALHAKVISVDMRQTLITSANLSYHGQQGNIELGALIESEHTAKQLDEMMTQLIFKKIFREV